MINVPVVHSGACWPLFRAAGGNVLPLDALVTEFVVGLIV
ncbi:hypothetical protein PSE_4404 [Pseudovibrio sp. FO-BEG1]|nr:hypothetical protein PSE_4404 [Pseudovibrio sp. FO-BEG1]